MFKVRYNFQDFVPLPWRFILASTMNGSKERKQYLATFSARVLSSPLFQQSSEIITRRYCIGMVVAKPLLIDFQCPTV